MDLSPMAGSILLRHGKPLRLQGTRGRRIGVLEGLVWVTQAGDRRDIVLEAGEEFVLDLPQAIASALEADARIVHEEGLDLGNRGRSTILGGLLARLRCC